MQNHYSLINLKPLFTLTIIFFGVILLYWPGLNGPFLLDDLQSISEAKFNEFSWQTLFKVSTANDAGPLGRPLSVASFALNEQWMGVKPYAYKLVNLGIHLFTGFILFSLLSILFKIVNNAATKKHAGLIALVCTTIWLIHPLQVSTVLYVVQRMAQLSTFFMLLSMLFYSIGRHQQLYRNHGGHGWVFLAFLCWPLAVLSKENGIILPFFWFAIEFFIVSSDTQLRFYKSQYIKYISLLSLCLLIAGISYYFYNLELYLKVFENKGYTLYQHVLTEVRAICFYIGLIFLPRLSNMSLFHDDFIISNHLNFGSFLGVNFLLLLVISIFIFRRTQPIISFGLAWFFIGHCVESSVLPLEPVFEHRNYLASIGLLIIPTYYGMRWLLNQPLKPLLIGSSVAILTVTLLTIMSYTRIKTWANTHQFLYVARIEKPNSPRAHVEWANWLLTQHQYTEALQELQIAHELSPKNAGINLHQVLVHCKLKTMKDKVFQQALTDCNNETLTPYAMLVLDNLVRQVFNKECIGVNATQVSALLNASIKNPSVQQKPNHLSMLYHLRAGIEVFNGSLVNAVSDLEKAYQIYPKRLDPLIEKANLEIKLKQKNAAHATLDQLDNLTKTYWVKDGHLIQELREKLNALE